MAGLNATSSLGSSCDRIAGLQKAAMGRPPLVFLFSGHGAQTYQMGREIYDEVGDFRNLMDLLDRAIRVKLGVSVLEEIYADTRRNTEPLESFVHAHCGIFMVELSLALVLVRRIGVPERLVGASLGELTASVLSGALTLDQALELLGHHITVLCEKAKRGFMLAIVGGLDSYRQHQELQSFCEVVSTDDDHFVVAGFLDEVERVHLLLDRKGIAYQDLPVSYPFHTSRIDQVKNDLLQCREWSTSRPAIPVLSCATGDFAWGYSKAHMWRSIREPVQTAQILGRLEREGLWTYIDVGPGSTMASALRRRGVVEGSIVHHLLGPFGNELTAFSDLTALGNSKVQQGEL